MRSITLEELKQLKQDFFTPREVADLFGVRHTTVLKWLASGKLKGVKIGSRWRIKKDWLLEFVKTNF